VPDFARHISVIRGSSVVLTASSGTMSRRVDETSSDGLVPGGDEITNVGPSLWAYRAMNDGGKRLGEATEHIIVTRI
jgi:hypothetical protein